MGKRWKRRDLRFGREKKRINYELLRKIGIWVFQILLVCAFAFVFVWYFGQRITNNGDSMNPVLKSGDVTLVNRIVYDASAPKRGDIIVFKPNGNENTYFYIKRIIGLPGETVQIKEGGIYIDGEVLEEDYETSELSDAGIAGDEIALGGDEYFVLGDNRESSDDSRMADIGNVKKSEIEGKAWFVLSPKFGFIK
ncbi:MAG: signal peptidase I [Lachnospiraceae bacterium]